LNGLYFHPPGTMTRWGVVDVGLKCPHSCQHCFYSFMGDETDQFVGMRHARWHKLENLAALIDSLAENGFLGFDVTGGEPSAYPGIATLVRHAARKGLAPRMITLAQFLATRDLLARLLDAGIVDFRFSLHATESALFERMTGGDLGKMVWAMNRLDQIGFQYVTNTTVTQLNYARLPEIARWIAARPGVYHANFLLFMPYYEWSKPGKTDGLRARYGEAAPYVQDAVAIVEAAGIAASVRYAPLCMMKGLERNYVGVVGVRFDIHEWGNAINHTADPETTSLADMTAMGAPIALPPDGNLVPALPYDGIIGGRHLVCAARPGAGKVFPEACRGCAVLAQCDGIDPQYVAQHGVAEFRPYAGRAAPGFLHPDRLRYRAGHIIKVKPDADARAAVAAALDAMRYEDAAPADPSMIEASPMPAPAA